MSPSDRLCSIVGDTARTPPEGWAWGGFWYAVAPSQTRDAARKAEVAFMARHEELSDAAAYAMLRRETRYGVHSFKRGDVEVLVTVPMDDRSLSPDALDESIAALAWVTGDDAEALNRYVLTGQR